MDQIIEILKLLALSIIQAFSEILPISSSGHLALGFYFFNLNTDDYSFFIQVIKLGSFIGIGTYFRKDLASFGKSIFKFLFRKDDTYKNDCLYVKNLLISTAPLIALYIILKYALDYDFSLDLISIGFMFFITSAFLGFSYYIKNVVWTDKISTKSALTIGIFQMFSILPGVSRTASSISGGVSQKIAFKEILKFTFLSYFILSVPSLIIGFIESKYNITNIYGFCLGFLASTFLTILLVHLVMKKLKVKHFLWLSIYVGLLGILSIVLNFL